MEGKQLQLACRLVSTFLIWRLKTLLVPESWYMMPLTNPTQGHGCKHYNFALIVESNAPAGAPKKMTLRKNRMNSRPDGKNRNLRAGHIISKPPCDRRLHTQQFVSCLLARTQRVPDQMGSGIVILINPFPAKSVFL